MKCKEERRALHFNNLKSKQGLLVSKKTAGLNEDIVSRKNKLFKRVRLGFQDLFIPLETE